MSNKSYPVDTLQDLIKVKKFTKKIILYELN